MFVCRPVHILLLLMCVTVLICGMWSPHLHKPFGLPHPLLHFAAFAGVTGLIMWTGFQPRRLLLAIVLVLAIGLEAGQFFVPNRTVEIQDFALNLLGVGFSYVAWHLVQTIPLFKTSLWDREPLQAT